MRVELSKDADKMLCVLYKEYLQRRKDGMPKADAMCFEDGYMKGIKPLSDWLEADISATQHELADLGCLKESIDGSCYLTESAVTILENRFKNGLKDVVSFLASILPTFFA